MQISEYKYRMTVVVPELLMSTANILALLVGESSEDINTFLSADWQYTNGQNYAICSAVVKPIVFSLLEGSVEDTVFAGKIEDITIAQSLLKNIELHDSDNPIVYDNKILIIIDKTPLYILESLGFTKNNFKSKHI